MPLKTVRPMVRPMESRTALPPPKEADAELQTAEHRAWRLEVMKRAGWRCQWPGCTKQGGKYGVRLYADHIRERRDGGDPLDPTNGQALCGTHHTLKGAQARAARMKDTTTKC